MLGSVAGSLTASLYQVSYLLIARGKLDTVRHCKRPGLRFASAGIDYLPTAAKLHSSFHLHYLNFTYLPYFQTLTLYCIPL